MNEILRRWARPIGSAGLTAEVSFTIGRDGSVTSIRVIRSSRSYSFDLEAQGAVEQAAADNAFGPLPAGWQADILNVAFLFTPRRQ
jgi:protein TonB